MPLFRFRNILGVLPREDTAEVVVEDCQNCLIVADGQPLSVPQGADRGSALCSLLHLSKKLPLGDSVLGAAICNFSLKVSLGFPYHISLKLFSYTLPHTLQFLPWPTVFSSF